MHSRFRTIGGVMEKATKSLPPGLHPMMIPPATAAEANSMARNKSPLPRKTVAKKRSSSSPRRSRSTPMNHQKAMPANGTRFSARATLFELVLSRAPVSSGSARAESRNSKRPVVRRTEKRMPATATAGGAFNHARIKVASWQLLAGLLIDVPRPQSSRSHFLVENFLLHRKRDPFFQRKGIGPQCVKLQENIFFVLCHPLALQ